jgi:hypothetical protein
MFLRNSGAVATAGRTGLSWASNPSWREKVVTLRSREEESSQFRRGYFYLKAGNRGGGLNF